MDQKERWQVTRLHERVMQGAFSEEDVFVLLVLLREYAPNASPVRECADFVAHRERDRGLVFNYLQRTKGQLKNIGKINAVIEIKPVFSANELRDSFTDCLAQFGLAPFDEHQVNCVLVCIISLLQHVPLVNRDGVAVGVLQLAISQTEVILLGSVRIDAQGVTVVFPALVAKNDFEDVPESSSPYPISEVGWAECKDGRMSLRLVVGS